MPVKRMVWLALVAGCGGSSEPVTDPVVTPAVTLLPASDPAAQVVERAFGARGPRFPLLADDGSVAAVEVVTPVGQLAGSTYAIGFVSAGADAWSGGEIDLHPVVDGQLLTLLSEQPDATYDVASVLRVATEISGRLDTGRFRAFAEGRELDRAGAHVAGGFRFEVAEEPSGAISIEVREGTRSIKSERIEPQSTGLVVDRECVARPRLTRAFADAPRHRLLLQIGWRVEAPCPPPEDKYRLYAP